MTNQTVEIRLQLLKDIGEGLSQRETVKHLVEKFGISQSGAYYHFQNKEKWLSQFSFFDKEMAFQVRQRYNYIYREAAFQYLHSQNDNARIGYLRVMLDANAKCSEYLPAAEELQQDHERPEFMPPTNYYTEEEIKLLCHAEEVIKRVQHRYFEDLNKSRAQGIHRVGRLH